MYDYIIIYYYNNIIKECRQEAKLLLG